MEEKVKTRSSHDKSYYEIRYIIKKEFNFILCSFENSISLGNNDEMNQRKKLKKLIEDSASYIPCKLAYLKIMALGKNEKNSEYVHWFD